MELMKAPKPEKVGEPLNRHRVIERDSVWTILNKLHDAGYQAVRHDATNDGSTPFDGDSDGRRQLAIDAIYSVDECTVWFAHPSMPVRWIFFVLGNEPGCVAADWTFIGAHSDMIMAVLDAAEETGRERLTDSELKDMRERAEAAGDEDATNIIVAALHGDQQCLVQAENYRDRGLYTG